MQILPTESTSTSFGFFSGIGEQSASGFLDAMNSALDSVAAGDYSSASSALADESNQPLVESPYTRHTSNGITYTLDEVCFTKQELTELREQLIKEGAPVESLKQFDILASQPDGATLAQVMASLMSTANNKFSEDDAQAITSLLGQIDPSGQLATDALDLMRQGNGAGALELIQNALADMGADMGIDIDPSSLLSLGRGLGLNDDSLRNLLAPLHGRSVTVNAASFDKLMQPAKNQFLTDAANADKLNAALEKTLKPIIAKARDRMEKEEAASALRSRRVEQSKILIDRTVQQNSRDMMDKTVTGEAADERLAQGMGQGSGQPDINQAPNVSQARFSQTQANNASNSQNARNEHDMQPGYNDPLLNNAIAQESTRDNNTPQDFLNQNRQNQNKPTDEGWQDLLGRLNTRPMQTGTYARNDSMVYSMLQGDLVQQASFAPNETEPLAPLPQQLASQVEQGLLTAMRDGATRLDLQLHPAELGTIAITLISRNGEITAQLRSEKSETAELMNRQLETIRVNLEEQGLKIDKIEVQLENRGENADRTFDNLDQHNSRQQDNVFRENLQRLRNLASVRGLDSANENLAQNMHIKEQMAKYAAQGLHVVA